MQPPQLRAGLDAHALDEHGPGVTVRRERVGLPAGRGTARASAAGAASRAAAPRSPAARARRRPRGVDRRPGRCRSPARRPPVAAPPGGRIAAAANGSPATSSSAGPRHRASASRGRPPATSRSKRVTSRSSGPSRSSYPRPRVTICPSPVRLAQLRHVQLDQLDGRRRRSLAPQAVDQAIRRHGRAGVERQQRQQRARLARADGDRTSIDVGLHGSQEPNVHRAAFTADTTGPLYRDLPPVRPPLDRPAGRSRP